MVKNHVRNRSIDNVDIRRRFASFHSFLFFNSTNEIKNFENEISMVLLFIFLSFFTSGYDDIKKKNTYQSCVVFNHRETNSHIDTSLFKSFRFSSPLRNWAAF